ncbi:uncharacterized protein LOC122388635 [Amphibalanus amphitrite]|uniref:uncharacterized protein LOC122388635 n=1 Tax=Amphibalanus amphitrite TaxID=1232801 RepID=UPI001C90D963|nr:uncharacterized protein LOC122388635 [Amphibalanus amphitrite]
MLVFSSDWGLMQLANGQHWFADGTFKAAPALFTQLYTLHTCVLGQTFPCVYALLVDKTERTYRQLLSVVREAILERFPDTDFVGSILIDLEIAAKNAVRAVFPEKELKLCFFHMSQAVWRKVQELGLQAAYAADADFALKLRCLPAIAFLQEADIPDGFGEVGRQLPDEAVELLPYFERTYIGHDVAGRWIPPLFEPREWCQYDRTLAGLARTTNALEGWHHGFQSRLACNHPSTATLLRTLRDEEDTGRAELDKLIRGLEPGRRRQWVVLAARVQRTVERRQDGELSVAELVRGIAHNFAF